MVWPLNLKWIQLTHEHIILDQGIEFLITKEYADQGIREGFLEFLGYSKNGTVITLEYRHI